VQWEEGGGGLGLRRAVGGLIKIKIAEFKRGPYDEVAGAGSLDGPSGPVHQERVLGQTAGADLTPADKIAPFRVEELSDAGNEVALKGALIFCNYSGPNGAA
jgi:hypothetical protein